MNDDFLANIPQEGSAPFAEQDKQETETPASSPADNKPDEATPSTEGVQDDNSQPSEKEAPFHKNPRWQQMREENQQLKSAMEEMSRWRQETDQRLQAPVKQAETKIPSWFIKFFGDNAELYQQFNQEFVGDLRSSVMNELKQEQTRVATQQKEELSRWDKWVEDSIDKVQEKFDVQLNANTRNSFLKFVTTYLPTDQSGNVDLVKGWELYNQLEQSKGQEKAEAKKALAAKVTSDNKSEAPKKDFQTSQSLRNTSWLDIAKGKI